jgi:hypothetical protein
MTEEMETIKAFVRDDNTVTIVCPNCSMPKNVSVAAFKNKCHFMRVRCPCQTIFRVQLDFRRHYRKPVDLPGIFKSIKPQGMNGEMQIKDISQGGVGFTVPDVHFLDKGHVLTLTFSLDDKKQTRLVKEVVVTSVDKNFIGCSFVEKQAFNKELGFYLKG